MVARREDCLLREQGAGGLVYPGGAGDGWYHPGRWSDSTTPPGSILATGSRPTAGRSTSPWEPTKAISGWRNWRRGDAERPKENARRCHGGHCPSWARTRTLLIQRGRCNRSNSGNLPPFTRVRVTRCRSLLAFMSDFAVLYSLKCRSLPDPLSPLRLVEPPVMTGPILDGAKQVKVPRPRCRRRQDHGLTQGGGGTGPRGDSRLPALFARVLNGIAKPFGRLLATRTPIHGIPPGSGACSGTG